MSGWGCERCMLDGDYSDLLVCTEECDESTVGYDKRQHDERIDNEIGSRQIDPVPVLSPDDRLGRCGACGGRRHVGMDGMIVFHEAATVNAEGVHDECRGTGRPPTRECQICREPVNWIDCPTGGWWAHAVHPADSHDAQRYPCDDNIPCSGCGGEHRDAP